MTVIRPIVAFFTAVTAGMAEHFFNHQPAPEATGESAGMGPALPLTAAVVDLLGDIGPLFLLGVLLAGVIAQLLPTSLIDGYLGNPLAAMLVMLVVGLPMYVCATASTPIAAALVLQGLNPGAALVFLMVGPATNAATIVSSRIGGCFAEGGCDPG